MSKHYRDTTRRVYRTMHNLFDAAHTDGEGETDVQILARNVDVAQEALFQKHGLPRTLIKGLSAIALYDAVKTIPLGAYDISEGFNLHDQSQEN
jgi:hypothetical protein